MTFKRNSPVMVRQCDSDPWQLRYFSHPVSVPDGLVTGYAVFKSAGVSLAPGTIVYDQCRELTPEEMAPYV